ncbi:MAG: hypothetical protein A2Y89_03465 [Chloroflexi bacterium RBG_13_51_18]|nr:MAG: hypothetical protein A2Y89_03465 [Chloroflexi bacterium RBG_13_51_18]
MVEKVKNDWKDLAWETKVQISEQSRANENDQLQNYRLIFIAIEAILFAVVFGAVWKYLVIVIFVAILGILLTVIWWHVTRLRGEAVDRWEKLLYELWVKVRLTELKSWEKKLISQLKRRYKGGAIRWEKKQHLKSRNTRMEFKAREIVLSARWWLSTVLPFLTVIAWIAVLILR